MNGLLYGFSSERMGVPYVRSFSAVGNYTYNHTKPHALTDVELIDENIVSLNKCETFYNLFNKIDSINESDYAYKVNYYPNKNQALSILTENGDTISYKQYAGKAFEIDYAKDKKYFYIYAYGQPVAVFIQDGENEIEPYYIHTDHLGSIDVITDANGDIVDEMSFDVWGNRRDLYDWSQPEGNVVHLIDRGFTGHQHLDVFNLINMGGRVYDPVTAQFLSPDPYVQDATSTQALNRYLYCYGSPLMYIDPDGEWVQYVVGAIMGGISGWQTGKAASAKGWAMAGYIFGGAAIGAASAGIGTAISSTVSTSVIAAGGSAVGAGFVGGAAGGMVSGAINGAGMTALAGGNFNDVMNGMTKGAIIGGLSGGLSGGINAAIGDFTGVQGGAFKNAMAELGHSALKGTATGLAGGAITAAMEGDINYLWKGVALGAALNTGMAGLRIAALGAAFIPDPEIYCELPDYGQVYRRGSIFMPKGSGITLGRNVAVKFTGNTDYDRYLLWHETGHLSQINDMGMFGFYGRTFKEYINPGFRHTYYTPGTLEYAAEYYAFQRLGYYYNWRGLKYFFP